MGLLRVLIGLRDDLDLPSRWWHRLTKVMFVLAVVLGWGFLTVVAHRQPMLDASNTVVLQTLREYMEANKQIPNALPSSVAQPGRVGVRTSDGKLEERLFLETQIFCSWDLLAHPEEEARFLSVNHPGEFSNVTVPQVKQWMKEAQAEINAGSCMDPADVIPNNVDSLSASIVRFEITGTAEAMSWVRAFGEVGMYVAPFLLVLMNVYYRGIVYVICGPRKRSQPPTAA
jgi:hypothetical protein